MINALVLIVAAGSLKPIAVEFSMSASSGGRRVGSFVGVGTYNSDRSFKDWCCETYSDGTLTSWLWRTFDKNGRPIRLKYIKTGYNYKKVVTLVYGARDVAATVNDNGNVSQQSLPIPSGLTLENKAIFWFVTKSPKVGDSWTCRELDFRSLTWTTHKATYERDESMKINGKSIKTHVLVESLPEIRFTYTGWYGANGKVIKQVLVAKGIQTVYHDTIN